MKPSTSPRRASLGRARTPLFGLLLAASLWTSGCGGGQLPQTESASAELQHLELRLVDESAATAPAAVQVARKLYPPKGVAPWTGTGMRLFETLVPVGTADSELPGYVATGEAPQAPAVVVLADAGTPREIRLPGPFEPASFNQVMLRLAVPQEEEITITLHAGGEERARSKAVSVAGNPLPQLAVFDLPVLRNVQGLLEELRIEAAGHTQGLMVLEVVLSLSPMESFLAPTSAQQQLIDLGGAGFDKRLGVGLYSGAPAETVFEAPAHHSLAFSYAVPLALRLPGSGAKLQVSVEAADGARIERTLPISSVLETWRSVDIPLGELGDGQKRALFEILAPGGGREVCAITELRLVAEASGAPTVVIITSDTHRGDHLGALGPDAPVRTPALDALAARGVVFVDAYAASNTTNPSHTSLMTGVHVRDTRVMDNRSPLMGDARTLAEAFQEAGYHTLAAVSVRHLMDDESGLGQGFDRMSGPLSAERNARETTSQVAAWLEELEGEPVFLWFHVFDAHSPYEPPASTDRRYYDKSRDPFDPSRQLEFSGKYLPVYLRGLTDIEFPYAQYRAEIDALDRELSRVLTHPRLDEAVIAFTADHGESFGAHGIWWDHAGLHPDTLHIPLILSWPGGPRGAKCEVPVRQMDLGRTLLDLVGETTVEFEGSDLRAALAEGATGTTRYSISKDANSASILDEGWLLNLNLRDYHPTAVVEPRKRHRIELYDLNSDPEAERECASAHPERAKELRGRLVDWLSRASARGLASEGLLTAEQRSRLAGLGYTGDGADASARAGRWIDPTCGCSECARYAD